jgi:hypothetical protein
MSREVRDFEIHERAADHNITGSCGLKYGNPKSNQKARENKP